ncbi:MAG: hypothetical protein XE03_1845 [candidate division TA06 bacterium 34_109]|uniref:Uncharacterized protein n=1 Tax=candidate division TA06 bacterium 34_109 TaxID=1635277 RepID=A0A117M5Q9_UNCT6|nr:MAG: hypothetical protein XE03_1845 [candidate division TA06 bacterium 34_109]
MTEKKIKIDIYQESPSTEQYFYLHNGIPLKCLAELIDQLVNMDEELFRYHVNENNNDFANWVRDVFGAKELARRISMSRSAQGMLKSITKYLES